MRKVYLVMGTNSRKEVYNWISGVYSSMKKAKQTETILKKAIPENNYNILIFVVE